LWVLIDPDTTRACIDRGTTEGNSTAAGGHLTERETSRT